MSVMITGGTEVIGSYIARKVAEYGREIPYLFDIKRVKEKLDYELQYTLEKGSKDYIDTIKLQKCGGQR